WLRDCFVESSSLRSLDSPRNDEGNNIGVLNCLSEYLLGRAPRLLDLFDRRLRELMRLYADLQGKFSIAEDLHRHSLLVDEARFPEGVGRNRLVLRQAAIAHAHLERVNVQDLIFGTMR